MSLCINVDYAIPCFFQVTHPLLTNSADVCSCMQFHVFSPLSFLLPIFLNCPKDFFGGNNKRLPFFSPLRGSIESFGFDFFCCLSCSTPPKLRSGYVDHGWSRFQTVGPKPEMINFQLGNEPLRLSCEWSACLHLATGLRVDSRIFRIRWYEFAVDFAVG